MYIAFFAQCKFMRFELYITQMTYLNAVMMMTATNKEMKDSQYPMLYISVIRPICSYNRTKGCNAINPLEC